MFDLVKKTLFTGIGLATLTREKLQELGHEVAEKAKLTEAQAREFQEELETRAGQAQEDLQSMIDRRIEAVAHKLGLARREQIEELTARIAALETRLETDTETPRETGF